nr:hypothetical protein [Schaalia suimastitidis]
MKRRSAKRPWNKEHPTFDAARIAAIRHSEIGPDGLIYQVQHLRSASKSYTCPGCLQAILPGHAHVVAWPEQTPWGQESGPDARRHWHSDCWRRKLRPRS